MFQFCFFFPQAAPLFPGSFPAVLFFQPFCFRFPQLFLRISCSLCSFSVFLPSFLSDLFSSSCFCKNTLFLFCQFFSLLFQPVLFPYRPNPQFSFRICKFFCDFRSRKFILSVFHRSALTRSSSLLLPHLQACLLDFRSCFLLILFCPDPLCSSRFSSSFLFLFLPSLPIALQYFKTAPPLLQPP